MNTDLTKKIICLALFSLYSATSLAVSLKKKPRKLLQTETKSIESARIISCAVKFPNNSVRFSEDQVTSCMNSAKLSSISYIHVIATASSTGSGTHNLYLSTRRAGAIEAFLNNRYPKLQVHAFGGGENPKFGKVARIFIVENDMIPNEISPGVQVAAAGSPEVIERITTKYVTKLEYKERPKQQVDFHFDSGLAKSDLSEDRYNYLAIKASKTINFPKYYLNNVKVGMRFRVFQSDFASDINSINISLAKKWDFYKISNGTAYYEHSVEFGQMRTYGRDVEYGTSALTGIRFNDFQIFTVATISNYLRSIGVGVGGNI